jgi:hypothetical protein
MGERINEKKEELLGRWKNWAKVGIKELFTR